MPLENCELCKKALKLSDSLELNVSECSKCHKLVCEQCIEYREDLKKYLCNMCYIELKPKQYKNLLSFVK